MIISVIIVGYNSPSEINALLSTLCKLPSWSMMEILVAENGNTAVDTSKICMEFGAKFVHLPNPGFGAACNYLVKISNGNFLAFINPDTLFDQDIFPTIISHLNDNPNVGASAPCIANIDGTSQISWNEPMDLWWEFVEAVGFQTAWRKYLIRKWRKVKSEGPWTVGFSSGACLIVRRNTFLEAGGFDEDFFLNYEDIELCDRIRSVGYQIHVHPNLHITHHNSIIQGRDLTGFVFNRLQAKWTYICKHYTQTSQLIAKLLWWIQALLRILAGIILLRGSERTRIKGYISACQKRFDKPAKV